MVCQRWFEASFSSARSLVVGCCAMNGASSRRPSRITTVGSVATHLDDALMINSEVAGFTEGHPRSVEEMDHLQAIRVDHRVLELAAEDDVDLVGRITDPDDRLPRVEAPGSSNVGQWTQVLGRQAVEKVRPGQPTQNLIAPHRASIHSHRHRRGCPAYGCGGAGRGRSRSSCIPPSTAMLVPVVDRDLGLAR